MSNAFTVKVTGLDVVERRLKGLGPDISKKVLRNSVAAGARVVRKAAEGRVPVDTGTLKRSLYIKQIREESNPSKQTYYVGSRHGKKYQKKGLDAYYFPFVEFGTEKMAARPFLRPAFESSKDAAANAIGEKLKQGVDKYANYTIG
jgi:HK97 gp10 family phage protein